jgi:hypothetical protein
VSWGDDGDPTSLSLAVVLVDAVDRRFEALVQDVQVLLLLVKRLVFFLHDVAPWCRHKLGCVVSRG